MHIEQEIFLGEQDEHANARCDKFTSDTAVSSSVHISYHHFSSCVSMEIMFIINAALSAY